MVKNFLQRMTEPIKKVWLRCAIKRMMAMLMQLKKYLVVKSELSTVFMLQNITVLVKRT